VKTVLSRSLPGEAASLMWLPAMGGPLSP
jgi:hypothetical protein